MKNPLPQRVQGKVIRAEHQPAAQILPTLDLSTYVSSVSIDTPAADVGVFGVLSSVVTNEENDKLSKLRTSVFDPAALSAARTVEFTEDGTKIVTSRELVPASELDTATMAGMSSVDVAVEQINKGHALKTSRSVASFPTRETITEEPETGMLVTTTRSRSATRPTWLKGEPLYERKATQETDDRWALEVSQIDENVVLKNFISTRNIQYEFPSYLPAGNELISGVGMASGSMISISRSLNEKCSHTLTIPAKVITTYHKVCPLKEQVFNFYPVNVDLFSTGAQGFPELENSLKASRVLCDANPILWYVRFASGYVGTFFSSTYPTWLANIGALSSIHPFGYLPESSPNATLYAEMQLNGYSFLAGVDIQRWKFNLWRQERIYVETPNMITPGLDGLDNTTASY